MPRFYKRICKGGVGFSLPMLVLQLLTVGCGYVGDPLPPALNIPNQITDLRAVQRGGKVFIEFTIPAETTESLPITSVDVVDLRAGPIESQPFNMDAWAGSARQLKSAAVKPGGVRVEEPAGPDRKSVV